MHEFNPKLYKNQGDVSSTHLLGAQKLKSCFTTAILGNNGCLRRILASCVCGTVEIARNITNKKNGPQERR